MFVQPFLLKKYYLFFQRKGAVVQRRNKVIVGGFLKVLRPKPFAAYKFVNAYIGFCFLVQRCDLRLSLRFADFVSQEKFP